MESGDQSLWQWVITGAATPSEQHYQRYPGQKDDNGPPTLPNNTRRSSLSYVKSVITMPMSSNSSGGLAGLGEPKPVTGSHRAPGVTGSQFPRRQLLHQPGARANLARGSPLTAHLAPACARHSRTR
jgi:hypothetical protein